MFSFLKTPFSWIIAWIIAISVFAAPAAWAGWGGPITVEVAPVREEMLGATVYLTGDLQASRRAVVGAEVEGRVAEMLIDEGVAVEAGDPLIRLDTRLLELAVERDEARLAAARARLERRETGLRADEIAQRRAEVADRRAQLASAQIDHDSQSRLHEESIISETEFAAIEAVHESARAELESAEAALRLAEEGFRAEEIAEARAEAAELMAELGVSRETLERATVRAPFRGVVATIHTEVGEWLQTGDDVAEVLETDALEVVVDVPELAMPRVRVGMRGEILVDALPGEVLEGEVIAFEPVADLTNRTYPVHVRVLDPPPTLLPGMFTRVAVETAEPAPTLLMSADALVDRGRGTEAWVVAEGLEGLTANPRRIQAGRRRGDDVEILAGLDEGERVVTAGHESLFPGASVVIAGEGSPTPPPGPPGGVPSE